MAVGASASASARNMYTGVLTTTTSTNLYTAPALNANVTTPSATAYVKEICLCNYGSSAVTVTININGQPFVSGLTINGNDTKVISGLNTMISGGGTITGGSNTASAVSCIISGVEVQ